MADIKWYVVRAVSGQENKVKQYLDAEVTRRKLGEFITEVLIPKEKVLKIDKNGKKKTLEKPYLPGYIIVSADLSHGEALHAITSIPGVLGFLGNSEKGTTTKTPVPLRQSEINRILGVMDESVHSEAKLETPFMVGETVKVTEGPFSGFTGTVEEVFEERKKLNVTVKIFGRSTPVELKYVEVEKVS